MFSTHSLQPSAGVFKLELWVPSYQHVHTNALSIALQAFSPAQVIFSGVGILLSVSILLDPGLEVILTPKHVTGGNGY